MLTSDSITTIMPAFIKAQGAFAKAVKSATNPHFKSKFVPLDGVIDAVAQPLRDNGIAIMQQTDVTDHGGTILNTRLIHESGEWIGSRYPVHPVKADPQGEGSALTYARRYALMALVGIAPEDDDGNAAVKAADKAASGVPDRVSPMDGVWESVDADEQAFLLSQVAKVRGEFAENGVVAAAAMFYRDLCLTQDEQLAAWTQMDSKIRGKIRPLKSQFTNAERKEA